MIKNIGQNLRELSDELNQIKVVEHYQCPGCVCGSDFKCFELGNGIECGKHVPGTLEYPIVGKFFLGLPKGFNRLGHVNEMRIQIFNKFSNGWGYDKFNVPIWKYLDGQGNTIIRGLCPRINAPFLHIFLGDCRAKIDCLEITNEDLDSMD